MNAAPILLVEDNDDDADLTVRAFKEAKVANRLVRVKDGVEALDYLHARGVHQSRAVHDLPAFVLLDLNLPGMRGLDVLSQIRAHPGTRLLPVVVLTSSAEDRDRLAAYSNHANSYVRKPTDYRQFVAASSQLGLYWTVTNLPPP